MVLCIAWISCQAFGQKINNEKTQIFFSKNVDSELRNDILQHTGFAETINVGRYLRANIAHGRTTRSHFRHIVDKVQSKLAGWKNQCLSLAGRVTLTQSVLSSIPYFGMQYSKIPRGVCVEIEKIQRGFVWGDSENGRKPHLVNWEVCCTPKKEGGLGIKRPGEMNDAFLQKILWQLVTEPNDLWCQVLKGKYGRNHNPLDRMIAHSSDSPLWKALTGIWEKFQQKIIWNIGDGKTIKFWLDKWVPNKGPLIHTLVNDDNGLDTTITISDMVKDTGRWNVELLQQSLPINTVQEILAIPPPTEDDGAAQLGWQGDNHATFTTKSAYTYLCTPWSSLDGDWTAIWKWKGPYRIQTFMWIAAHG